MFDLKGQVFTDDLDVALDAATYADPQQPAPIDEGAYGFTIDPTTLELVTDKEGKLVLDDGKYPIVSIGMVEVVDPQESKRKVPLYQRFRTKPFDRFDYESRSNVVVNALSDLIRSADASVSYRGIEEGLNTLMSLVAQNAVFHARLRWSATDVEAAKEEAEAIRAAAEDPKSDETRKAVNAVWKKYRVQGQRKFNGKPFIISKDGDQIPARVEVPMDGFIPVSQLDKVVLGPKTRKAA